jgi:predicted AlkP superfamily pyrophosphatase or phosphodiesterase
MKLRRLIFAILALLLFSAPVLFLFGQSSPQSVVLLSFDGFRFDYRAREITPTLDSLAHAGVSALSLRPVYPSLTFPNHYAIITGQYPQHHGIINNNMMNPLTGAWFRVAKDSLKKQSDFYTGEALWETARKYGLQTASHSYPASDINDTSRRPNLLVEYNPKIPLSERVDTILAWLQLPETARPRFICAYIETVDAAGHEYGVYSSRTRFAIREADALVNRLCTGLREANLDRTVNVIIVSDHGMTNVSSSATVDMNALLDGISYRKFGAGELMQFQSIERTYEADEQLLKKIQRREMRFKTYRKETVPAWYGSLKHAFVMPLVAIADNGWLLDDGTYTIYGWTPSVSDSLADDWSILD